MRFHGRGVIALRSHGAEAITVRNFLRMGVPRAFEMTLFEGLREVRLVAPCLRDHE